MEANSGGNNSTLLTDNIVIQLQTVKFLFQNIDEITAAVKVTTPGFAQGAPGQITLFLN